MTVTVKAVNDSASVAANSTVWVGAANNDSASNGAALSVLSLNLTGTKGTAKLNPNATNGFTYIPNGAFNYLSVGQTATDTLQYTVTDAAGDTSTATVTVVVSGVNFAPVAGTVSSTTAANTPIAINALTADSDVNQADTLTITALNLTNTKGTATIDSVTGKIDYSPNGAFNYLSAGETATDTLRYTVSDNHGATSTSTVAIAVTGVEVPPVANPDSVSTTATQYVNIAPLTNDTDVNRDDKLTVTSVNTTGTKGTVTLNTSSNTVTWMPYGAFNYLSQGETATDSFQYTISDGHGGTSTATDTVVVSGVNFAPTTTGAYFSTSAYVTFWVSLVGKYATDVNLDDKLTITAIDLTGTKGTAFFNPSATNGFNYKPNGAFNYLSVGQTATDTLHYTVSDNFGATSVGTVTVTVSGVNVAPVAAAGTASTSAYSTTWVSAVGKFDTDINQADTLSITALDLTGTKGTAWLNPAATNGFSYNPNGAFNYLSAGETATDTFHYTVSDNHGATSTGVMTVTVSGVNVAPVAGSNTVSTYANQAATINVLANDTDINRDDVLTVSSVNTTGTRGSVAINADGTVTYTPQGADAAMVFGQSSSDSFTYTVSDGHGGTSTATVTVNMSGPPPNVSDLLGSGYLSTQGSQFVNAAGQIVRITAIGWGGGETKNFAPDGLTSVNYQSTMLEMKQAGFNTIRIPWSDALLTASPAAGTISYTLNPDLQGLTSVQVFQKIVAYAGQLGMKIIFDHHDNEGSGAQQPNGLWYDVGGASNGTDGAGNVGTVSQATFQTNWVNFASMWAGNSTVIGFDLANEPVNGTWLGPSTTSIQTMATQVGNAIQAVDPGALIIVEGGYSQAAPEGDLSLAGTNPVTLGIGNKVVYSVHEYPQSVNPSIFSGDPAQYIKQMNADWGYLVTNNTAPVWIGELGSQLATASDQLWAQTLMNYMNGYYAAEGGPVVAAGNQGVSGDYWAWASGTGLPPGMLMPGYVNFHEDQYAIAQQLFPEAGFSATTTTVSNSLVLSMAEDYYQGNAQFKVAVDGVQVGGVQTVTAIAANKQTQSFYLSGNFSAGSHTVTVTFLNDLNAGVGYDRNLYIKGITFDGVAQTVTNANLFSNGSVNNTISASGTVTATSVPDTIILQASDNASGSSFAVYVDGNQIGNSQTLTALTSAGATQTFAFQANLGGGAHQIDVKQLNVSGASTINVSAIDYDGSLQSLTPTNASGTPDQVYTMAGPSVLNAGTIQLGNDTANVVLTQPNQMVFMAAGTHAIETDATGITLKVGGGSATVTNFNPTLDTLDLTGGIGGFVTAAQVQAALTSDGSGGSMLNLATGSSLDFINVAQSSFTAATFKIG
jgi:VCBS repeat-containing protein